MHDPLAFDEDNNIQLTVNNYRTLVHASPARSHADTSNSKPRKSRAKRYEGWEKLDHESGGKYTNYLHALSNLCPTFSRMEFMIATLVMGMLSNLDIAERFGVSEDTIENHRVNIRRKLGIPSDQNLAMHLLSII